MTLIHKMQSFHVVRLYSPWSLCYRSPLYYSHKETAFNSLATCQQCHRFNSGEQDYHIQSWKRLIFFAAVRKDDIETLQYSRADRNTLISCEGTPNTTAWSSIPRVVLCAEKCQNNSRVIRYNKLNGLYETGSPFSLNHR
jgi:hypothetical protein